MKRRSVGRVGTDFSPLLAAASRGEPEALAELHRRYVPSVLRRIGLRHAQVLRRQYDTLDLSQSVFLELLRDLPRFENRGEAAFRKWLLIKAKNKVRMKLRHRLDRNGRVREDAIAAEDELRSAGTGPATRAGDSEERDWVRDALRALSLRDRRIVFLRTRDGLAYGAIAEKVGLESADAARMRFARALLTLRRVWPGKT